MKSIAAYFTKEEKKNTKDKKEKENNKEEEKGKIKEINVLES